MLVLRITVRFAVICALFAALFIMLAGPAEASLPSHPKVHAGMFCAKADRGHHILGKYGIELVCAPAEKHHSRWRIYIPAPQNPYPYQES